MAAKYLYGIIRNTGTSGIHLSDPVVRKEKVHVVAQGGIAAVVSDHAGPPLNRLPYQISTRQLSLHDHVMRAIIREQPILPAKVGTVFPDEASLRETMRREAGRLLETLRRLDGLAEYEIAARWEPASVLDEIAEDAEIARLRALAEDASGLASFEIRLLIAARIKASFASRLERLRGRIASLLAAYAVEWQSQAAEHDGVVLNAAVLMPRRVAEELLTQIEQVDSQSNIVISVRSAGPLPPRSFATIEIALAEPDTAALPARYTLHHEADHCAADRHCVGVADGPSAVDGRDADG